MFQRPGFVQLDNICVIIDSNLGTRKFEFSIRLLI